MSAKVTIFAERGGRYSVYSDGYQTRCDGHEVLRCVGRALGLADKDHVLVPRSKLAKYVSRRAVPHRSIGVTASGETVYAISNDDSTLE